MYGLLFRLVFRWVPAESAHQVGFGLLRAMDGVPPVHKWLRRRLVLSDPSLTVRTLGLELPGPIGLAAGFDKDGRGVDALGALGFAFIEVGTVTASPQPGNPRPRLFRLVADRALVNRMGFNNEGAAVVAARLRRRRSGGGDSLVVGVNIGKTKVVPDEQAPADYAASARLVADVADYVVVNVSSPNTVGLRSLQAVAQLRPLLMAVRAALDEASSRRVPLLVKIAPDLDDAEVDAIADLALDLGLDGIIASNTTTTRDGVRTNPATVAAIGAGGLSGAPLKEHSLAMLRRLRARVDTRLVLISAGGIETAEDAWSRLQAGATLVQSYTGFVYGGPLWPSRMHRGLVRLARDAGCSSVADASGTRTDDSGG